LPPAKSERPILWIVAGPNGSGKSNLYENVGIRHFGRFVWIINPDLLAARIRDVELLELPSANLEAVKRIEVWLRASIEAHQTIGVETVLSTEKYRPLVLQAKSRQFQIRLIYVLLDSPDRNVERVRMRVAKGGHGVPEDKIRERHARSLLQLPWFLDQADEAWIFDNSYAAARLIGEKKDGTMSLDPKALPEIVIAAKKVAG